MTGTRNEDPKGRSAKICEFKPKSPLIQIGDWRSRVAQGAGPHSSTPGSALINLQGRLQGHRHLAAHLASDVNLYVRARIGPTKSLLKAITHRSVFLDPREQGWGWVGGVRGVYQGRWLWKCPALDPSTPISKRVLWEGSGGEELSLLGCLPLCSLPGCRGIAFTAQQDPGEQFCALLFLPGDTNY